MNVPNRYKQGIKGRSQPSRVRTRQDAGNVKQTLVMTHKHANLIVSGYEWSEGIDVADNEAAECARLLEALREQNADGEVADAESKLRRSWEH